MKKLCLLAAFLGSLVATPVWAIVVDAVTTAEGTTSTSHSHTLAADANIAVICTASRDAQGAVLGNTGVTVGGQAATFLVGSTNVGNVVRAELWYKLVPLTGAQTVAVTADATTEHTVTGVMSFKGVAQTSTFNTTSSAQSSATDIDINGLLSAGGEMGVMCIAHRTLTGADPVLSADSLTPVSVEQFQRSHAADAGVLVAGFTEDGAVTSIDMRVNSSQAQQWGAVAVSMRPLVGTTRALRRRTQ